MHIHWCLYVYAMYDDDLPFHICIQYFILLSDCHALLYCICSLVWGVSLTDSHNHDILRNFFPLLIRRLYFFWRCPLENWQRFCSQWSKGRHVSSLVSPGHVSRTLATILPPVPAVSTTTWSCIHFSICVCKCTTLVYYYLVLVISLFHSTTTTTTITTTTTTTTQLYLYFIVEVLGWPHKAYISTLILVLFSTLPSDTSFSSGHLFSW